MHVINDAPKFNGILRDVKYVIGDKGYDIHELEIPGHSDPESLPYKVTVSMMDGSNLPPFI